MRKHNFGQRNKAYLVLRSVAKYREVVTLLGNKKGIFRPLKLKIENQIFHTIIKNSFHHLGLNSWWLNV